MWLKEMIDHHEMAIKMSKMAIKEAEHQELKDLAENIINAQSKEINQMKAWIKEWSPSKSYSESLIRFLEILNK
jgi:uncharacterized protein (DUF305 family)